MLVHVKTTINKEDTIPTHSYLPSDPQSVGHTRKNAPSPTNYNDPPRVIVITRKFDRFSKMT